MCDKISVVVPVFNAEHFVLRCIRSVLQQTHYNFELVIVDDGSSDRSGVICDEAACKDERIVVFHQKNQGVSAARNVAIDYAFTTDSEYIACIDSDDWVAPTYLETLLAAIKKHGTHLSACNFQELSGEERARKDMAHSAQVIGVEDLKCDHPVVASVPWAKLYRKELFQGVRYPVDLRIHEDESTTFKIVFAHPTVAWVPSKLYYYFRHPGSLMAEAWSMSRLAGLEADRRQIEYFENLGYRRAAQSVRYAYVRTLAYHLKKGANVMDAVTKKNLKDELVRLYKEVSLPWAGNLDVHSLFHPRTAKLMRIALFLRRLILKIFKVRIG